MNILEKFNQIIGFTKTESRVVLFLIIVFVAGIGIKLHKSSIPEGNKFNYSGLDSEFASRSQNIRNNDSAGLFRAGGTIGVHGRINGEKIDLNVATAEELISLPGIGEVMAERIIRYRSDHGVFRTLGDLMKVKGIGKKKFEQLAPFLTVRK